VPAASPLESDFASLESELRKLESEYNMFFAGRLPRPPWETRSSVAAAVKRLERVVQTEGAYAERFRFHSVQARFATFVDLWDRGLRAREEGRPGPFGARQRRVPGDEPAAGERIVAVTLFADPMRELDKLHELYDRLTDARREVGARQVPFHKFAGLIRDQVRDLQQRGAPEVAFRVAIEGGKISFMARAVADREQD